MLAATAYVALPAFGLAAAGLASTLSFAGLATQVEREREKLAKQKRANKFLFLPRRSAASVGNRASWRQHHAGRVWGATADLARFPE